MSIDTYPRASCEDSQKATCSIPAALPQDSLLAPVPPASSPPTRDLLPDAGLLFYSKDLIMPLPYLKHGGFTSTQNKV